jgi:hypothetical protein
VLETRSLPKKFFGRVQLVPKGAGIGLWARLILEIQFLRYMAALVPFIAIPFMSNDLALPVTQAPLAMVLVIAVVEMRVLRLTDRGRQRIVDEDEAARRLDLRLSCAGGLAADRGAAGIAEGEVMLVAEQSELARVPPLTLVSVQSAVPQPHVVDLDPEDRAILEETLFDEAFTERMLHDVNMREGQPIREVRIEARSVSAHARLAAALNGPGRPAPAEA